MAGEGLLQLFGQIPNEQDYYNQDPFYNAGTAILRSPIPQATNNTDAILLPLLQGLAGGGIQGYGKGEAIQQALGDAASIYQSVTGDSYNPMEHVGPVASGDVYGAMLDNGGYPTIKSMKGDILNALMEKEKTDALDTFRQQEQIKSEMQNSQMKDLLATGAKGGSLDAAILLAPKQVQPELIKEKTLLENRDKAQQMINDAFDTLRELNANSTWLDKNNPFSTAKSTYDATLGKITTALQDLSRSARPGQIVMSQILKKLPGYFESDEQLNAKQHAIMDSLGTYATATPLLNALKEGQSTNTTDSITPSATATGAPPPPLPGESREDYKKRVRGG